MGILRFVRHVAKALQPGVFELPETTCLPSLGAEHCNLLAIGAPPPRQKAGAGLPGSSMKTQEANHGELPESISKIPIYSIRRITADPPMPERTCNASIYGLDGGLHT
jgi:hypothetical protein